MLRPLIWSLINIAATVLIPFGLFTVFARTGEAWQVGAVGIAIGMAEIIKTVCPQGLYEVLLHRDTRPDQDEAAFGFLLLCGGVASIVFAGLIALAAQHSAELAQILPALLLLAPKILFDVSGIQPQAAMVRQGMANRIAVRTLVANVVASMVGAVLAVIGHSLHGLIAYYLVQSVLGFVLTMWAIDAPASPRLRWAPLRSMLGEAGYASGVRLVGAANSYADTIVVAAFVSPALVGAYNLAKRIETVLMSASASLSTILYQPVFAQRNAASATVMVENAVKVTTLLFGLPLILFISYSRDWVGWVFGARWVDAAPICAMAAISGLARTYGSIHGALLSVTGRNRALLANAVGSAVMGLGLVASLAGYGLIWVALGIAMKSVIFCLTSAWLTMPGLRAVIRLYTRHALVPLAAGAILAASAASAVSATNHVAARLAPVASIALSALLIGVLAGLLYREPLHVLARRISRSRRAE
jgi:teichuronic acid exporter